MNSIPYTTPETGNTKEDIPVKMSRAQLLEISISQLEKELEEATNNWTLAKSTRDEIKTKTFEDDIVRITSSINVLKMRRSV